jgi:hypothetical protein
MSDMDHGTWIIIQLCFSISLFYHPWTFEDRNPIILQFKTFKESDYKVIYYITQGITLKYIQLAYYF